MLRSILPALGILALAAGGHAAAWSGSGTYTVGSTGADYPTLGAFFQAMTGHAQGTGTITAALSSTSVTGTGTSFLSEVAPGDQMYSGAAEPVTVLSVESDTALTLNAGFSVARSSAVFLVKKATAPAAVSGNVTVEITSDLTEPNNVPVLADMGANILTIKPAAATQPKVTFTRPEDNSGLSGHLLFGIGLTTAQQVMASGVDNFVIDGSNNGTNSQDLTFYTAANYSFSTLILVAGDSDGWTIKNCKLINESVSTGSSVSPLNIRARKVTVQITGFAPVGIYTPHNFTVQNNFLSATKAGQGAGMIVDYSGHAMADRVSPNDIRGFSILDNKIESRIRGIFLNAGGLGDIRRNRISVVGRNGFDNMGIWLNNGLAPAAGTGNWTENFVTVNGSSTFAGTGGQGISITSAGSGLDRVYNVENNVVVINVDPATATTNLLEVRGIRGSSAITYNIHGNSVSINDSANVSGQTGADYQGISTPGALNYAMSIKNNIVKVSEQGVPAIRRTGLPTTASNFVSENNVLSGDVVVQDGTTNKDLPTWQADGFDLNSNTNDPGAVWSAVDLHFGTDPGAGWTTAPLAGLTIDVDGQSRSATAPNVGADEFSANTAPTGLSGSDTTIAENTPTNTIIGTFQGSDPDSHDVGTVTLTDDAGGRFKVVRVGLTDTIQVADSALIDFESGTSHSITGQFTDRGGLTVTKSLVLSVTNVNEAPTAVSVSSAVLAENYTAGTVVGTLSSVDQDAGDTHSYALVAGTGDTDNASFQITGDQLSVLVTAPAHRVFSIRVQSTDSANNTYAQILTITVDGPSVVGGHAAIGDWAPANSANLYDDGTNGDAVAGDLLYSRTVDLGVTSAEWKVLRSKATGWGTDLGRQADGGNMISANATGNVTYFYDKRDLTAQSWEPATESLGSSAYSAVNWVAVGGFQSEAGETGDWNPDSTVTRFHDDGLNGDVVANDGIYTFAFAASAPLSSELWKVVADTGAAWTGEPKFGPNGWSVDPGDSSNGTLTANTGDTVTLEFDPIRGHMRSTVTPLTSSVSEWNLY